MKLGVSVDQPALRTFTIHDFCGISWKISLIYHFDVDRKRSRYRFRIDGVAWRYSEKILTKVSIKIKTLPVDLVHFVSKLNGYMIKSVSCNLGHLISEG